MIKYQTDPLKIKKASADIIKKQVSLEHLSGLEQQIAIQMIQACGDTSILDNLRFSESAAEIGLQSLEDDYDLLCDTVTVACAVKDKYLKDEPICLIRKANVISQAKAKKHTRSMTAIDLWKPYLADSIILIGEEPTALFKLLEILENMGEDDSNKSSDKKPALIIATPAGFTGALEAKEYLWKNHEKLGIPCITLLGERGGNALSSIVLNVLLRTQSLAKVEQK
jgi:precorrin-8X/cobalt-precorrin-8 methylmutase